MNDAHKPYYSNHFELDRLQSLSEFHQEEDRGDYDQTYTSDDYFDWKV